MLAMNRIPDLSTRKPSSPAIKGFIMLRAERTAVVKHTCRKL